MDIVNSKIDESLILIDEKIEELASCIHGYYETMANDIVYEEAIDALDKVKNKLELILEILTSNESIQKDSK